MLEAVSLEEEDDPLIETWAQLLVGATAHPESSKPIFIDVLKKIQGEEANVLEELWKVVSVQDKDPALFDAIAPVKLLMSIEKRISRIRKIDKLFDALRAEIDSYLVFMRSKGAVPISVSYPVLVDGFLVGGEVKKLNPRMVALKREDLISNAMTYVTLGAVQVLTKENCTCNLDLAKLDREVRIMSSEIDIQYYRLSRLGFELLQACHIDAGREARHNKNWL
jgi:hypothetical protein